MFSSTDRIECRIISGRTYLPYHVAVRHSLLYGHFKILELIILPLRYEPHKSIMFLRGNP